MKYRALSVVQPSGRNIAEGRKTIEVRKWRPDLPLPLTDLVIVENAVRLNGATQPYDPDGRVVALVDVTGIRPWEEKDVEAACGGAFKEGWLAWELSNIRQVFCPEKVPARLRIYDVELDIDLKGSDR